MGGVFFIGSNYYSIFPLDLITNDKYSHLSSNSKILYVLFLNRLNLSKRNLSRFSDSDGVFIHYPIKKIQEDLCCSVNPAINAITELQQAGLICKKHQKLGLPVKIYVKDIFGVTQVNSQNINTYKPKQNFKTPSPALQKEVSFNTDLSSEKKAYYRKNFGDLKNKRTV